MASFIVLGEQLEFHDDLKKYYKLSCDFENKRKGLYSRVETAITQQTSPLEILQMIDTDIRKFIDRLIGNLVDLGVFDKTIDDFLEVNSGYLEIARCVADYYDFVDAVQDKHTASAAIKKAQAEASMKNASYGLDFGIISSSLIDHVVYSAMNHSESKRQRSQAAATYLKQCTAIDYQHRQMISNETLAYYKNNFVPKLLSGISPLFADFLSCYVSELHLCSKFDKACLQGISYERSCEIIKNLEERNNKRGVILKAIELCPFNLDIYRHAHSFLKKQKKTVSSEFGELIHFFELEKPLAPLLVSLEVLSSNAEKILKQNNFAAAKDKFSEIIDLFPESELGWKGLLLSETQMFHSTSPDQDIIERCLAHIKPTANSDIYNSYEKYTLLLKELSDLNKQKDEWIKQRKSLEFQNSMASSDSQMLIRFLAGIVLVIGIFLLVLGCVIAISDPDDDLSTTAAMLGLGACVLGYFGLIHPLIKTSRLKKEQREVQTRIDSISNEIALCATKIKKIHVTF